MCFKVNIGMDWKLVMRPKYLAPKCQKNEILFEVCGQLGTGYGTGVESEGFKL